MLPASWKTTSSDHTHTKSNSIHNGRPSQIWAAFIQVQHWIIIPGLNLCCLTFRVLLWWNSTHEWFLGQKSFFEIYSALWLIGDLATTYILPRSLLIHTYCCFWYTFMPDYLLTWLLLNLTPGLECPKIRKRLRSCSEIWLQLSPRPRCLLFFFQNFEVLRKFPPPPIAIQKNHFCCRDFIFF